MLFEGKILSIAHILVLSRDELVTKLQISASDVNKLLDAISLKVTEFQPCSALDIWNGTCDQSLQVTMQSVSWVKCAKLPK